MFTKNEKIEELRSSIKIKDEFLTQKVPGIIKTLKEALGNFVIEVEKTIIKTGNTQFGSISLFLQDDTQKTSPDELLKTYQLLGRYKMKKSRISNQT